MSGRPTPEQIGRMCGYDGAEAIDLLREHGYVIVHPDDVPEDSPERNLSPDYYWGWDSCRRYIFEGES